MRKCSLSVPVSLLLLLPLMIGGCRARIYRSYSFEPAVIRLSTGTVVEVQIDGSSRAEDSADVSIDVTGNPYTLRVYLDPGEGNTVDTIEAMITGLSSGAVVAPQLSSLRPLSDGRTLYVEAKDTTLQHEDQVVAFTLGRTVGEPIEEDTFRVVLRKIFNERKVSFGEWFSGL